MVELKDVSQIGTILKAARRTIEMTQQELAYRIGTSYHMIARYERGVAPMSFDRFLQLCDELNLSVQIVQKSRKKVLHK